MYVMEAIHAHKIHPEDVATIYLSHTNAAGMLPMVLDMRRSRGVHLYDELSGRRLVDFFGFFASSALGMNHPKLTGDTRFLTRLQEAALNKVTNSDIRTAHMARFLQTFARNAMPDELPYAFFVSGGALAVENALKAAFDWKVRKNFQKGYRREVGHQVLHLEEAFHGRSGYTLSLTNTADPRKILHFPKFDWPRISNPKITFPLESHLADVERRERLAIAQAERQFHKHGDDIACIVLETIQGEGGDNHFRTEFLRELKRLSLENDALLIFDEVQCGVGITGSFWAWQSLGVEPDIIAFGKKTQVCGILAGRRIDEVGGHVFATPSRINSTWGGNLVDMVRFDRILEIIEEDGLVDRATTVGAHLLRGLHVLAGGSSLISNVRGRGLMCAFDLPTRDVRDRVIKRCYDDGLVLMGCGKSSMRFRSPLVISEAEIDEGLDLLRRSLSAVENAHLQNGA